MPTSEITDITWVPLGTYGFIQVSGQDARAFLQGQLTCDMNEVTHTQSRLGAYCNHKGRIRSFMRILKCNDNYLLCLPKELLEKTMTTLKQYTLRSKVNLEDVSHLWQKIGIIASVSTLKNLESLHVKPPEHTDEVSSNTHQFWVRLSGESPRFEIFIPSGSLDTMRGNLLNVTQSFNENLWQLFNIQAGIPEIFLETSEAFLPHTLNLPALRAVNFKKGCYCGQEIIARMQYRTTVKRHMFRMSFQTSRPIEPGNQVVLLSAPDKPIGSIVSVASIDANQYEALIEIPDEHAESNTLQLFGDPHGSAMIVLPFT